MASETQSITAADFFLLFASLFLFASVWAVIAVRLTRRAMHALLAHVLGIAAGFAAWFFLLLPAIGLSMQAAFAFLGMVGGAVALYFTRGKKVARPLPPAIPAIPAIPDIPDIPATPAPVAVSLTATENKGRSVDELSGLVCGMMADGVFVQAEADYLFRWLQEKREQLHQHPFNVIYHRLDAALADGVLDEAEAADLGELFKRLVLDEPAVVAKIAAPQAPNPPPVAKPIQPPPAPVAAPTVKPKAKRAKTRRSSPGIDRVLIQYEDSMGFESEREVTVHSLDAVYLKGFCHLRNAVRTFKLQNIVGDVVRVETGELLSVNEWLDEVA